LTTIGSRNTALITVAGTQRWSRNRVRQARQPKRHITIATAAIVITGTNSRKHAWPWISSQPDSATIHTSRAAPAATEAAAITNATYGSTYMFGIQSEFAIHGYQMMNATTTAEQVPAAAGDRVQPYTTMTAIATNAQFSANTASMCAFHAVGTACRTSRSSHSPAAWTYMYAGPGWWNPSRE